MGVLMLLINNINMKVSERGRQGRHKLKTQINRLLKKIGVIVLLSQHAFISFIQSLFLPRRLFITRGTRATLRGW